MIAIVRPNSNGSPYVTPWSFSKVYLAHPPGTYPPPADSIWQAIDDDTDPPHIADYIELSSDGQWAVYTPDDGSLHPLSGNGIPADGRVKRITVGVYCQADYDTRVLYAFGGTAYDPGDPSFYMIGDFTAIPTSYAWVVFDQAVDLPRYDVWPNPSIESIIISDYDFTHPVNTSHPILIAAAYIRFDIELGGAVRTVRNTRFKR